MNRADLQKLAKLRVREAKVLLKNSCYAGAYYLLGYAVECAIKACVAKQTKEFDFPNKSIAKDVFTHDLTKLIGLAGLTFERDKEAKKNAGFDSNWAIVKDWKEDKRYSIDVSKGEALAFHSAVLDKKDGILSWLQKWW